MGIGGERGGGWAVVKGCRGRHLAEVSDAMNRRTVQGY